MKNLLLSRLWHTPRGEERRGERGKGEGEGEREGGIWWEREREGEVERDGGRVIKREGKAKEGGKKRQTGRGWRGGRESEIGKEKDKMRKSVAVGRDEDDRQKKAVYSTVGRNVYNAQYSRILRYAR